MKLCSACQFILLRPVAYFHRYTPLLNKVLGWSSVKRSLEGCPAKHRPCADTLRQLPPARESPLRKRKAIQAGTNIHGTPCFSSCGVCLRENTSAVRTTETLAQHSNSRCIMQVLLPPVLSHMRTSASYSVFSSLVLENEVRRSCPPCHGIKLQNRRLTLDFHASPRARIEQRRVEWAFGPLCALSVIHSCADNDTICTHARFRAPALLFPHK